MALSTVIAYAVALSLPAWLVAEQIYAWQVARADRHRVPRPSAGSTVPAFSPKLDRNTA